MSSVPTKTGPPDGRVEVEKSPMAPRRSLRWRVAPAVLIVIAAASALVLVQRPYMATESARAEAVEIAEKFIGAQAKRDHLLARSLVGDAAVISMNPVRSPDDLEMGIAWMDATGWVFTNEGCKASRVLTAGDNQRVLCYLTHESAWSRALKLAPDTRSALTVETASGEIVEAFLSFAPLSFPTEAVVRFDSWIRSAHPEDLDVIYRYVGLPSLTPESIELWARYTDEFVADVSAETGR